MKSVKKGGQVSARSKQCIRVSLCKGAQRCIESSSKLIFKIFRTARCDSSERDIREF